MVKTAHLRNADNLSPGGRLDGPGLGRILVQRQMAPAVMVVVEERLQMARQTGLIENDDMIQAFAAYGANHPFYVRTLPGRPWGRQDLFDAHGLHLLHELLPEDPVPVAEQIAGAVSQGKASRSW